QVLNSMIVWPNYAEMNELILWNPVLRRYVGYVEETRQNSATR
ncbi:unnamed protein product, partial [Didymodactylos carnosus]